MRHLDREGWSRSRPSLALLAALVLTTLALSLAASIVFDRAFAHRSLLSLSNLIGPSTESLLRGRGLTACTTDMGTPGNPICFHAARMPLPSLVVALGIRLFGDRFLPVALFKTIVFVLPIECGIFLVWRRMPRMPVRRGAIVFLLLAPFAMTLFLADLVNLQVEEGYAYSLLALAVAILFFGAFAAGMAPSSIPNAAGGPRFLEDLGWSVTFACATDALYLTKSSMAPAAAVLAIAFLLLLRSIKQRILLLLLVAAAPIGWAMHQHHASGRYSVGTSLDGINLHKANVSTFLDHYPPPPGSSLDQYDADLNVGLSFPDEWSFDDFHQRAALAYIRSHPGGTFRGGWRKFRVLFFSLSKTGSSQSHGLQLICETAGMVLFRIILWTSITVAVFLSLTSTDPDLRRASITYLAVLAACTLPYLAGFAYTRHASILVYPACLMCCRSLYGPGASK